MSAREPIPTGLSLVEVWRREAAAMAKDPGNSRTRREVVAETIRACADDLENYTTARVTITADAEAGRIEVEVFAPTFDENRVAKLIVGRLTALHGATEEADAMGQIPAGDAPQPAPSPSAMGSVPGPAEPGAL